MSSSNASDAPFADFEETRIKVRQFTVDRLKQIIIGFSYENNTSLSKSGKKQDLIDRITDTLEYYRKGGLVEQYTRARAIMQRVRQNGFYTSAGPSISSQSTTSTQSFSASNTPPLSYQNQRASYNQPYPVLTHYSPYVPRPPILPPASLASTPDPPKTNSSVSIPIKFKPSPFYKIEQAASGVIECPESTGSHDRHTQSLQFVLTHDQIEKLKHPNSKYQLRLYCTTSTFYSPTPNGFRSNTSICPIEFPATCEVRVNDTVLQANLKGIKKKPGTAPPADLSKLVRQVAGQQNRIEMVYVNSQQNAGPKKYYLVVFLVEVSTVDQLVERLRKGKFRSSEEIKAQMIKQADDDDEIVMGKQKMTLKCPLSYTRITVPCRSNKCVHSQCFDAISWYSVMEQTTTWLCPVCEKQVNPEELIIDGYFGDILKKTPDSVEEVEIEPDGEWHTADNKLGSPAWMDALRSKVPVKKVLQKSQAEPDIPANPSVSSSPKADRTSLSAARLSSEVFVLSDSDEEDETRVKRELSPTSPSSATFSSTPGSYTIPPPPKPSSTVIDLTLDSDDESVPASVPPSVSALSSATKRKAPGSLERETNSSASVKKLRSVPDRPRPEYGVERHTPSYRSSSPSSSWRTLAYPHSSTSQHLSSSSSGYYPTGSSVLPLIIRGRYLDRETDIVKEVIHIFHHDTMYAICGFHTIGGPDWLLYSVTGTSRHI